VLGIRCEACGRVLAPPRPICDRDFVETDGWVELARPARFELFTIMYLAIDGLPEPPYVLAYVRPDGADTAIGGFLEGVDLACPEAGGRAADDRRPGHESRVRDERQGRITDLYFKLA